MKKKNGFTLIELLIVIIILVVIVLLTVPKILTVLDDFRIKSFSLDAETVRDSATSKYLDDVKENPGALSDRCYLLSDLTKYMKKEFDGYTGRVEIIDQEYYVYIENGLYYAESDETGEIEVKEYEKNEQRKSYSDCD